MINGSLDQASGQLRLPAAAIESEHELVDVFLQVSAGYPMVGTQQIAFQIGDDDMHGRQPFVDFLRWCDPRLMVVAFGQCLESREGVAANRGLGQDPFGELSHPVLIELIERLGGHIASAFATLLDRKQHCRLTFGTSSPLAGSVSADLGVIDFHDAVQPVGPVAVAHRLAQLAQHRMGGRPRHTEQFRQSHRRNATLVGAHQEDGGKPLAQRQFGVLEHGAGGDRSLSAASLALVQVAVLEAIGLVMTAVRADEAIRPAMALKFADTGFFVGEFLVPVKKIGRQLLHGVISLSYSIKTIIYKPILYHDPYAC